jgi:hypothetical protein
MIRFYFHPTPNPAKIALFLEEAGLAYEAIPVDTGKGDQHTPAFRAINTNGKVPAIVDTEGRFRLDGHPHLARREDRAVPGIANRQTGTAILADVHCLGTRPVFRTGRAFSVRSA